MNSVSTGTSIGMRLWRGGLNVLWPVLLALALLLIPTYLRLADSVWHEEAYAHGPFALLAVIWLVMRNWQRVDELPTQPATSAGLMLLIPGLMFYIIGRSQVLPLLEVGSEIPILAGVLLLLRGWSAVRMLWFPLFFILFLVPLPGFIIDAATGPLKVLVSAIVEQLLYWMGYPISRAGVMLTLGPYQLLVADACSGLNSIYSLSAMGLLYLYLMQRKNPLHTLLLILSIVPMAIIANVTRVMILALTTYYFGEAAGQGFVHDFAGMVLFIAGLLMLITLDLLLSKYLKPKRTD